MQLLLTKEDVWNWRRSIGQVPVSLVPTMGALHFGHKALIEEGKKVGGQVLVSIFVNPTQFGPTEDYNRYTRHVNGDIDLLKKTGVDAVFIPNCDTMYPYGVSVSTKMSIPDLGNECCGRFRPGHFDGVTGIVSRLFNLVQPTHAVFGEKDFQQLVIIQRLVVDLGYPITIIGVPTVREKHGLAISSRNAYLRQSDFMQAGVISVALNEARESFSNGVPIQTISQQTQSKIEEGGLRIEYVSMVDEVFLGELLPNAVSGRLLVAAYLGSVRLIDNIRLVR